MAINGRRKGAKAERVASKVISRWTKKEFSKTPASGGLGWKKANVAGDVVCTTEGHYCPFCFEIKSYGRIDFSHLIHPTVRNIEILDFWKQAKRDADKVGKIPILMMRYNGLPKEFYFLAIPTPFEARIIGLDRLLLNNSIKVKRGGIKITIFPSTEFFKLPYKEIRKIAKTFLNESKRK
jgi:hypothetical protein